MTERAFNLELKSPSEGVLFEAQENNRKIGRKRIRKMFFICTGLNFVLIKAKKNWGKTPVFTG